MKTENIHGLEATMYDMAVFGDETTDDQKDVVLIAETLLRLPEKARERVLEKAIFIITDGINGTVFDLHFVRHITKQSIILLNFANMRRYSKTKKMTVIAHEAAHFILEHRGHEGMDVDPSTNYEKLADDLAEKWGFERASEKTSEKKEG
jgi:hypothetical protein